MFNVRIGRWQLRRPELLGYATSHEDTTWRVGIVGMLVGFVLIVVGFVASINITLLVLGGVLLLLGDTATTVVMIRGIERRRDAQLAEAAARYTECIERIVARRARINELATLVMNTPSGSQPLEVYAELNRLLDEAWDNDDIGPGADDLTTGRHRRDDA